MRPAQIMKLAVHEAGGHTNVGYVDKNIYNFAYKNRTQQINGGDAANALTYLKSRKDEDKEFFLEHTENDEVQVMNLFWADSISRTDYACFGDLLLFDTTYKKNHYNIPLVIFPGINHHKASCIFASALLANESEPNYVWVLETLPTAMGNKEPSVVVTDGDRSMLSAIKKVFPDARHRLCSWHLNNNVISRIKQNLNFTKEWLTFVYANYEEVEFEHQWQAFVENCGLQDDKWVREHLYDRHDAWAHTYLQSTFLAGITTTSRCEGINSQLGRYLNNRYNLFGVFTHFTRWMRDLREKEVKMDFESSYSLPEIKYVALKSIELSGAHAFTRKVFYEFRDELGKSIGVTTSSFESSEQLHTYKLSTLNNTNKTWEAKFDVSNLSVKCSCSKFEHTRIPCSHMLYILKEEHRGELPSSFVDTRWSKNPKSLERLHEDKTMDETQLVSYKYGLLQYSTLRYCELGSKSDTACKHATTNMTTLCEELEQFDSNSAKRPKVMVADEYKNVKDPAAVRYKGCGNVKGKKINSTRKCSKCKEIGHRKDKCPKKDEEGGPSNANQEVNIQLICSLLIIINYVH
ncbi:Protein FAR1-RELATED SEQUENCE 5 [Linum perenne]